MFVFPWLFVDKPRNVQLVVSERTVCSGTVISFNCSADSDPAVHTYQLYKNSMVVSGGNSISGMWTRLMSEGGVFNYTCMVNNAIGTATSTSVSVTVNGKEKILKINKTLSRTSSRRLLLVRYQTYLTFGLHIIFFNFPNVCTMDKFFPLHYYENSGLTLLLMHHIT